MTTATVSTKTMVTQSPFHDTDRWEHEEIEPFKAPHGDIAIIGRPVAGMEGLAEAVIAQACTDYQKLAAEGIVVGSVIVEPFQKRKILEGCYTHKSEVEQLLSWLKDGGLQSMLDISDLKMDVGYILTKMEKMEKMEKMGLQHA